MNTSARGAWTSKLGFVLAAAGSAIGLGNIWRFPYVTGMQGGAAFVVVYLACVFAIGVPVMIAELTLGRHTALNPVGAIRAVSKSRWWPLVGYLGVVTGVGILSYYAVIAGWTVGFIVRTLSHSESSFESFVAEPTVGIGYFALFLILTAGVVVGGIERGIERWTKILMPLLFLILLGLIVFSLTLEGASKGIEFYLKPDLSKIRGSTVLAALGQAFFSLSLGMGTMITYGSYISKRENIPVAAVSVGLADTLIAVLAGLVIFPALFSVGEAPTAGPGLVFKVFPKIFEMMPGGTIVGVFFFVLLAIAALTSTVSLLEVPVAFLVDQRKWSRRKAVVIVTALVFVVGLPSALSQGTVSFLSSVAWPVIGGFLDQMDFIFGQFSLCLGGLLLAILVGWVWGARKACAELLIGAGSRYAALAPGWAFMIKYVCPITIILVLLNVTGVFGWLFP
ncbi:MAG: sodium-dependent transporter [Planctomycetota bacterium]